MGGRRRKEIPHTCQATHNTIIYDALRSNVYEQIYAWNIYCILINWHLIADIFPYRFVWVD